MDKQQSAQSIFSMYQDYHVEMDAAAASVNPILSGYKDSSLRELYQPLADRLKMPVESVLFIVDSIICTSRYCHAALELRVKDAPNHMSAADVCRAVAGLAQEVAGKRAGEVLLEAGIRSSEDVKRVVYALVDASFVTPAKDDCPADFDGLCNFSDPAQIVDPFKASGEELWFYQRKLTGPLYWVASIVILVFWIVVGIVIVDLFSNATVDTFWVLGITLAAFALMFAAGVWRDRGKWNRIARENYLLCIKCRYSLQGLTSQGTCPECGFDYIHGDVQRFWLRRSEKRYFRFW